MTKELSDLKISTPGRVCLFGEHQDYLNLPVIASAISLRISVEGHKRDDAQVVVHLPDINAEESFSLTQPIVYDKDRDYLKSVVNVLKRHGVKFSRGVECTVHGDIPINAGTSSSSALIVAWVNFMAKMSDPKPVHLTPETIAEYSYEAEVLEFSEPGGMMDQYSTAIGGVIFLDSVPKIQVTKLDAKLGTLVLGNSGEPKDTKFILARVKNQIQKVVKELQKSHPEFSLRTVSESGIDAYASSLTDSQVELLHGTIRNRDITMRALKALNETLLNHKLIGSLMNDHQTVMRDILKISTPKIDRMIDAALHAGAYGAKINGSGGGGCMFVYRSGKFRESKISNRKRGRRNIHRGSGRRDSFFYHGDSLMSDGRLVILAAGISSRMKKSAVLQMIVDNSLIDDADYKAKSMIGVGKDHRPFLDYLLYNARQTGYKDVLIIVGEKDESIRNYYGQKDRDNEFHGLKISYATQWIPAGKEKPIGTADALYHGLKSRSDWSGLQFTVCNSDDLYSEKALKLMLQNDFKNAIIDYDRRALQFERNRIEKFAVTIKDEEGFLRIFSKNPLRIRLRRRKERMDLLV